MSFRDRMKKKKGSKSLKKRHNDPSKNTSGGRYPTIFNKGAIPEGVEFFKCSEGEHLVDILPWEAGPDMPLDASNKPITDEGDLDYIVDVWVHQNIGKTGQPYVCPYENFGEPCPICEFIKSERLPKEDWQKVRAKRRAIYLLWDRIDRKSEKKGVQIFDSAHFFMEEKIAEIAKLPRGGGSIIFSDWEDGKTVSWTRKGSGKENTQYLGHKLVDRDAPIPDHILDQTFPLDSVINMHPAYEVIAKDFEFTKSKLSNYEPDDNDNEDSNESEMGDDVPMFTKDEEKKEKKNKKGLKKRKRPVDRKKKKKRKSKE